MTARRFSHSVRLHEPQVGRHEVAFRWDLTPATALYQADGFRLSFPPELDLAAVPPGLWLRLALLCLHPHWALLAPCRVELPHYLGPAEREFWLRMIDVAALQIEAYGGAMVPGRAVELFDDGPALRPGPIAGAGARAATAFSGGKDSLLQAGLLAELTDRPLLVTTTSPVPWARDHVGAARAETLSEIDRRLPVDLVEVRSDFRACWRNEFSGNAGCLITVNELTDVLLYQATTIAAAAAAGIGRTLQASEADLQYNASRRGQVIQHGHFASAAPTHLAVSAMLRPFGMSLGSLTYPLHMQQVQGLLWRRYRHLADLQFSCWQATGASRACSRCGQCMEVALVILDEGFSPTEAGIDPIGLMREWGPPRPGYSTAGRPSLHPSRTGRDKFTRILRRLSPEQVGEILAADPACARDGKVDEAVAAYRLFRARYLELEVDPEPGYIEGFLEFVDDDLRPALRAIYHEQFDLADEHEFGPMVSRSRSLGRWIAAPLTRGRAHGP